MHSLQIRQCPPRHLDGREYAVRVAVLRVNRRVHRMTHQAIEFVLRLLFRPMQRFAGVVLVVPDAAQLCDGRKGVREVFDQTTEDRDALSCGGVGWERRWNRGLQHTSAPMTQLTKAPLDSAAQATWSHSFLPR